MGHARGATWKGDGTDTVKALLSPRGVYLISGLMKRGGGGGLIHGIHGD